MSEASAIDDPTAPREAESPEALLERYETSLREAVESAGDATFEGADVDADAVEAIRAGDAEDFDLETVTTVLAAATGGDADALLVEVRDALLLSMSSAMLTVDRIAADVDGDLDAKEIQAKIEGRHPMTLAEYARINHFVADAT